uniref:Uncharacterized protein n=1 Tax=Euplotes crassus TaxID=5936 RepID=A0A7S3KPF8_EUPCR|mmetsp:Transcript_33044/g.32414  ORF Transcript_33044/g.32414 Transcript_33044/m.32414 type:complete len:134 (+) Transcript_33044:136-537(+)
MFRLRFHRCDKRNDNNHDSIVDSFLGELGVDCSEYNPEEVFEFLYPVLNKLRKTQNTKTLDKEDRYFTMVFDEESNENISKFINNGLSRQLIKFFLANFARDYVKKMPDNFKEKVSDVISYLASGYSMNLPLS